MPRKKAKPTGTELTVGPAPTVRTGDDCRQYSTFVKSPQHDATRANGSDNASCPKPRVRALPLDLSRQIDCCIYLEESIVDPLTRRFASILRRRLEEHVPVDGGQL